MRGPCMLTLCGALLMAAVGAASAKESALTFVDHAAVDAGTRVVDVRAQDVCEKASLAGARCLPAADLFGGNGAPVDYHTLRWLLGTIGLTGQERVLVVADKTNDAAAAGALFALAGQRQVAVLDRPVSVASGASGGSGRGITREAVFIAPMRDRLLAAPGDSAEIASGAPAERLRRFARRYAEAAAVTLRLSP